MTAQSFVEVSPARPQSAVAAEFLRYLGCSALALALDFGLYSMGLRIGLAYPLAALAGFVGGLALAYRLSVRYAFATRTLAADARTEFAIFAGVGVFGLLLTEFLLWLLIDQAGLHPLPAKLLAAGAVFLSNFAMRKGLLFSRSATALRHEV